MTILQYLYNFCPLWQLIRFYKQYCYRLFCLLFKI